MKVKEENEKVGLYISHKEYRSFLKVNTLPAALRIIFTAIPRWHLDSLVAAPANISRPSLPLNSVKVPASSSTKT